MKRQGTDGLTVNASGMVVITKDQYREYQNLLKKRDCELESLRTQHRLQEAEWSRSALRLARAITSSMIGESKLGVAIIDNKAAKEAYELAYEILATE